MHSINIWNQLPLLSDPIIQPTALASVLCLLQCISHTRCKSSRTICQCGDGRWGMSLWCVYLMCVCVFKCALSPQMLVEWPRCHRPGLPASAWGAEVFFLPPCSHFKSYQRKHRDKAFFFLFSHFSGQLCQVVILVPWIVSIKNKEIKWWLVLKSIGWNNICLQCELSCAQTDVQQGFQVDRGHIRISRELFFKYTYLQCICSTSMTSSDSGYS